MDTERKRVLFVMSRFLDGGIDTILLEYLKWFAKRDNYQATLAISVCLDNLEVFRDKIPQEIDVRYFSEKKWLTSIYKKRVLKKASKLEKIIDEAFLVPIRRYLQRKNLRELATQYDVLIDFDCCSYSSLRHLNIPKLAFFHFSFEHYDKQNHRRMKRISDRIDNYDRVILIAQAMLDEAKKMFPNKIQKFSVVYNPKDQEDVWRQAALTPNDKDIEKPFILAIERLTTPKDIPTLLRAYKVLREKYRREEYLFIIGKGEEENSLRQLAAELGIAPYVRFLGFVANPLPWLKASKMLVHSSKFEGMGMVLVEAMLLGKPVVATDCPIGPREVLDGGKAGLLTPVGDAQALAEAINRLFTDEQLCLQTLKYAEQQVQKFTLANAGTRLETIMSELSQPKILFVISRFLDGGIDTVLVDYLQILTASGKYQLSLVIEQDMDELEVFASKIPESVEVYHLVENNTLMKWRRKKIKEHLSTSRKVFDEAVYAPIRRYIIRRDLRALALQSDMVIDFDCCSYSFLADVPVPKVAWFHFSFREMLKSNYRRMLRISYFLQKYDRVVTISKQMYSEGVDLFPRLSRKLSVIYNAKDREDLLLRANESVDDERIEKPYILAVERLEESQKDISTLLRAYQVLKEKYHHDEFLYILGKGQSEKVLQQLVEDLGISDSVVFLGFHENPYPWIKHARLLTHSAKMEGLPTVLLEGLMLDKLIVSTDCPTGPSEILDGGKAGLLVPVGDAEAMAESIHKLLTSESLQKEIGDYLKIHRKHFMYEETLRHFDEIINAVIRK